MKKLSRQKISDQNSKTASGTRAKQQPVEIPGIHRLGDEDIRRHFGSDSDSSKEFDKSVADLRTERTVTLALDDASWNRLADKAGQLGLDVDAYLAELIEDSLSEGEDVD